MIINIFNCVFFNLKIRVMSENKLSDTKISHKSKFMKYFKNIYAIIEYHYNSTKDTKS